MAWRYKFDDGPTKEFDAPSTIYTVAAMAAFARESVTQLPTINVPGVEPYQGHVVTIWDDELAPEYGPYRYGIGINQCGGLTICHLT